MDYSFSKKKKTAKNENLVKLMGLHIFAFPCSV